MLTIGKLAGLTNVSNDTLRFYEEEGLLKPTAKSPAGYRLYDDGAARRVHFIKHAQECGFTLAEIRDLLRLRVQDKACCRDVRTRAIEKKLKIESKIRTLKAMSNALDELVGDCTKENRPVAECTILAAWERSKLQTKVQ